MNRKVLSALMAGTMLVSATACSGAKAASESVRAHNNPQTQASVDGDDSYYAECTTVAGVSAVNAAASVLGAPLMHDFAVISLSDWLTPWELIQKRVRLAGEVDFVIALYNPKSKSRPDYIESVQKILLESRKPTTPVGIVTGASREQEKCVISDLAHFTEEEIGMFSIVIIGNSHTYVKDGYMVTPRGYKV